MKLSEFLLAAAEARWPQFGFRPRLPGHTERFDVARIVRRVAIHTTIGILAGLGMALILMRWAGHPVYWVAWVIGSFALCQALVWHSLIAFVWNQRATRSAIPLETRTIQRGRRHRAGRIIFALMYVALIAGITPLALLWTAENVRSELLWKRERARMMTAGVPLDWPSLVGAAPLPHENAAATPIFEPFFDYQLRPRQPVLWNRSNEIQRIEERLNNGLPPVWPPAETRIQKPGIDLERWAAAYRTTAAESVASWSSELQLPANTNDIAGTVLAGLKVAGPELDAICEAARRPRAQFPIHFEEGMGAMLRHLAPMRATAQLLEARCAARLAAGDTNGAFADLRCSFDAAGLLREEPLLISHVVRCAQLSIATTTLWQGLSEHRWSDEQLLEIQGRLSALDLTTNLVAIVSGERAFALQTIELWIHSPKSRPDGVPPPALSRAIFRQNQIAIARHYSAMIEDIDRAGGSLTNLLSGRGIKRREPVSTPYDALVLMLLPAMENSLVRTARAQTTLRLAEVACALERYRIRHGQFPESIDGLAPAFLGADVMDPMTGQPFHYERTPDGWFKLYSIGPNGQDDGGTFYGGSRETHGRDWIWPVPTRPERRNLF